MHNRGLLRGRKTVRGEGEGATEGGASRMVDHHEGGQGRAGLVLYGIALHHIAQDGIAWHEIAGQGRAQWD